jgi:hypothetical protein
VGPGGGPGATGAQGAQGSGGGQGGQGAQGATGSGGGQGGQGAQGNVGPTGPQGGTGPTGGQGAQGAQGPPSDQRLKDNIQSLTNVLEKVKGIEGVRFEWVDHPKISMNRAISLPSAFTGETIGFIAQQIEDIVPEVVWTDEEGFKSVEYGLMVSLGIGALQEQQKRIISIMERIKILKDNLSV